MDHRPALGARAAQSRLVTCDQAIFTSLRSPTGEGYRIVAASPGITGDERREIMQRSPSHDSLCSDDPDTKALSAYPLGRGRHAVTLSRYAGREPSARGGQRVYTHIAVLEAADFLRVDCHPIPVYAALEQAATDPQLSPPRQLGPLQLSVPANGAPGPSSLATALACILDAVLSGVGLLVVNAASPFELLATACEGLPLASRRRLATSIGIKYSPSKKMQLTFANLEPADVSRLTRGQAVAVLDPGAASPRGDSPFSSWLDLVDRMWASGRHWQFRELTRGLDESVSAEALRAVVWVWTQLQNVPPGHGGHPEVLEPTLRRLWPDLEIGQDVRRLLRPNGGGGAEGGRDGT